MPPSHVLPFSPGKASPRHPPGALLGAVVGGEDDDRVVGDAQVVELLEQDADIVIELLQPSE